MEASVLGHYFEDFVVGQEIRHSLSKTIFESDNNFFFFTNNELSSCTHKFGLCLDKSTW